MGVIVEGHGEVAAVPLLLRRIARSLEPPLELSVHHMRLPRGRMTQADALGRAVELMARKVGPGGPVLVLLDADTDVPCELGPRLLGLVARHDRQVAVVVAMREYEAWFLAGAASLAGQRGLPDDLLPPADPEGQGSPKKWLADRMPRGYVETLDQPALSEILDLQAARTAGSFDKLIRDVARLLGRTAPARPGDQ